jgi:hypothetical protein
MTEKLSMSSLYDKLSQLGFNQDYIENNALPSWWSDELNDKPTAVLEGAGYISENFNLELKSLLREESIRFNPPPKTKPTNRGRLFPKATLPPPVNRYV